MVEHVKDFSPSVVETIEICAILPATICSIELPFRMLKRVKTWNRASITDEKTKKVWIMYDECI